MSILAIDAGTTGVTALVISDRGEVEARGYQEFEQHFPASGWVEHDPEQIWQATLHAVEQAIAGRQDSLRCIGITNQRETAVMWDRKTLSSPTKAIVWQDRRTSVFTQELESKNEGDWIRKRTGLNIDPYFTASKFLWWKRNLPEVWAGVESGQFALGTIDSYLVARLSAGKHHITDASNASRTQLMSLTTGDWDDELLAAFEIPMAALPKITPCWGDLADSDAKAFLGLELPITGMAGDQQAALFGQTGFDAGASKCTYGTGAFILTNTADEIVLSDHGLLATVAWMDSDRKITYASEGSVFVAGAAVQWLRDKLKIISNSPEVEALATSAGDSGGAVFVPALTGLGAPFWNADIRGSLLGLTRGTTDANIAYATLEGIAFQVAAVVKAMGEDSGSNISEIRVDGGAAANDLLMQIQSDVLGAEVIRAKNLESTGLGAGLLAGLGAGIWSSMDELRMLNPAARRFNPKVNRSEAFSRWQKAVEVTSAF
ncbi:MAG: glycerol kinase GlpK [Aquiluna sp.]